MKVIFFGTPEFAVPTLEALVASAHRVTLVVAQPDRPAGRGMTMQAPAVARRAIELGIPLEQPSKIRTTEFLERVRREEADLAVVVAYGRILPGTLLEAVPGGFINVHASLLPAWRGAAPIQRAIAAGETETGVTIMKIDEELDHGPMLAGAAIPIGPDEHAPQLAVRLAALGGGLLVRVLESLENGAATLTEQQHHFATHAPKLEKEEARVDWTKPARRIYDEFRAFDPWPGRSTVRNGEVIKLLDLERRPSGTGSPGTISALSKEGILVDAGEGAILIRSGQRPGRGAVTGQQLGAALRLEVGERFE